MAVTDQKSTTAYATDGISVAFTVPFYFKAFSDLVVSFWDFVNAPVTKVLTTDYLVSGVIDPKLNNYSNGGTVTMNVAPAAAGRLRISRRTPKTQTAVYVNGDPFPVEAHEVSSDTHILIAQEGPYLFIADGPPTHGIFTQDDKVENANKVPGGFIAWVYLGGLWYEWGQISQTAAG